MPGEPPVVSEKITLHCTSFPCVVEYPEIFLSPEKMTYLVLPNRPEQSEAEIGSLIDGDLSNFSCCRRRGLRPVLSPAYSPLLQLGQGWTKSP